MGEFELPKPWDPRAIEGVNRFVKRVWRLVEEWDAAKAPADDPHLRLRHKTIKRVTGDLERMQFNTAIAALMEYLNVLAEGGVNRATRADLRRDDPPGRPVRAPPGRRGVGAAGRARGSCSRRRGRRSTTALTVDDTVSIGVQVDGKLRGSVDIAAQRRRGRRARGGAGAPERRQAPRGPRDQEVHLQARAHHRHRLRPGVSRRRDVSNRPGPACRCRRRR